MLLLIALILTLPQDYVNLIMDGKYQEAIEYCQERIQRNKDSYQWKLEMGDIYYTKLLDFNKATEIYQDVVDNYKHKDGWAYYRLAQVLEIKEDYLNSARMYEVVATRFRKAPLDSFSLTGVERCFKKNYQDYVATVDGYNITRLELDEKTGRGGPMARSDERAILDQMIMERLIYASAVAQDVKSTETFKENYRVRSKLLLLDEVRSTEVMQKATPTEKQVKRYYKDNKDKYKIGEQVMGKEIVVESDSLARMLLDSLQKDVASFDTLAKLYSIESSARSGGNMGAVYRDRKPKPVEDVLFKTNPDNLTKVIEFDGKYGIYFVTGYKPEQYRDFEDVQKQIEMQVKNENVKREDEALIKRLRKKAKINVYGDSISAVLKDTTEQSRNVVLADVNNRKIIWADVIYRNENMTPQFAKLDLKKPDKVEELINTMIDENLRLQLAWEEKYYLYDGYFVQLKDALKTMMDRALYQKVVLDAIVTDSQEVAEHYEEHIEEFKVPESARIREILLKTKEEAETVRKLVMANPEAFDSLATEYSVAPSTLRGGEQGLIRRGMMEPEYERVIFSLKVGDISDVFNVRQDVWTIVKMMEYHPEHHRSLEEVKHIIESRLQRQKQSELANGFITKIREEANIEIFLPESEEEAAQESQGEE
jgi:peptidyl-prolyl cis-trans isomerase C